MKDNNFVLYRASAGSGKTYTLVREFLTLCLSSEKVTFGNILAVTFTNKAANEMKAKILNNLKGIITSDEDYKDMKNDLCKAIKLDEDQLKDRALKLYNSIIHNYSDLNVSTIDSFIQQVSRTFAKELNLPNQYKLLVDSKGYLDEIIQQIDKAIGNDDGTLAQTLTKYVKHKLMEEGKAYPCFCTPEDLEDITGEDLLVRNQAYANYIQALVANAKANGVSTKIDDVLKAEVLRIYEAYYESQIGVIFQNYYVQDQLLNYNDAGDKYTLSNKAVVAKFLDAYYKDKQVYRLQDGYVEKMESSDGASLLLYHYEGRNSESCRGPAQGRSDIISYRYSLGDRM